MHKITITPTIAVILLILPASSLAKIGDRRKISDDRAARVEPALKSLQSSCSLLLLPELDIDVSDHMVGKIIADVEALDLAKLVEFFKDVLVEVLEVLLNLFGVDGLALGVDAGGNHVGTLVHVG